MIIKLTSILILCCNAVIAQTPPNNIVEGGKLILELVKTLKTANPQNKPAILPGPVADICFTNLATDNILVKVTRKMPDSAGNNTGGDINLAPGSHECVLGLSPAIYHYKIYRKQLAAENLVSEGDLRLNANEKLEREIR